MKAKNSYIFIPKEDRKKKDDTIVINTTIPSICKESLKIDFEKKANNSTNDIINRLSFDYTVGIFDIKIENIKYIIDFKITSCNSIYYLDLSYDGKKDICVKVFEYLNSIFTTNNKINKYYIPVITYDVVSEIYCNRIYPKLNNFERKLRKLMFNVFTSRFKELYFTLSASDQIQEEVKKRIGNKKEEGRIQQYYYYIDMGMIRSILFDSTWTEEENKLKEKLLKEDFSKLKEAEIKKRIDDLSPKSNWDRFFTNKGFPDDIENLFKNINNLRNIVAHNRLMTKEQYDNLLTLLSIGNKNIDKALDLTETEDFKNINYKLHEETLLKIAAFTQTIFNNIVLNINLTKAINSLQDSLSQYEKLSNSIVKGVMKALNKDDNK